ncbi:MAG TPA: hybrid sensor histidine kinase/response regulator [Caulobacteraceae bacterium]|jgi:signal transduction histidine kinase/CheY-like chemotaxis protein
MSLAAAPTARADRVAAERIAALYRNAPVGVIGALFGVAVLSWVMIYTDRTATPRVEAWFALTATIAGWQMLLCVAYWRDKSKDQRWRLWGAAFLVTCFVEGCRWALGEIWLATPGSVDQQLWVLLVATSAASSSVSSLGSYTPAFYALLAPATIPFAIWGGLRGDAVHWAMALLDVVFGVSVALLGREQSRSLAAALRLRFENLDLAEGLAFQKERAEAANAAKTTFLASASHDLRQPLHALGLFVAALSGRRLDPGSRRLTDQIAESAEAMNGLFDALLDISQLDAGVVAPRPEVFRIQLLLARICAEQRAQAEAKGLALVLHPCALGVRADPALVEQIARNLISNAVRYTEHGRIVVGCRRRSGRLGLGVWDTGPGIAADDQGKVFEEFVQLGNPERDRAKGLGLGLAITRRIADLSDCPITLRSTLGKGSAFEVSLPRALAEPQDTAVSPTDALTLASRGLIAIVDDEAAIRASMASLLESWGYEVAAADTGDAVLADLAGRRPDLVICDWRLRGEETALAVVASVRTTFGPSVPALLVTGDTASERIREAHDTGLVLLHKPVPGGKLRAAIANLIRSATKDAAE